LRLNELFGKEIINIYDGARLGVVGYSDVTIDIETGQVEAIILPPRKNLINLWFERRELVIPWDAVKKIGKEVIIVDLDRTYNNMRRLF